MRNEAERRVQSGDQDLIFELAMYELDRLERYAGVPYPVEPARKGRLTHVITADLVEGKEVSFQATVRRAA